MSTWPAGESWPEPVDRDWPGSTGRPSPHSASPPRSDPAGQAWPEPVGRPARPHWWSIQEPPPADPITARRAYAEVLLVYAAFFAASVIAGAETLAHRYPSPSGSWAIYTPAAVSELAISGLALTITILLSTRRGISRRALGFGMPRKVTGKPAIAQSFRIGVWALVALVIGGLVTATLATGRLGQPVHQGASYLLYTTAASLAAGIVEETVVLAFVVSTLRQARRPLPEIVVVAVLLRCSYHDYYGPGVLGIAIWATVFIWLYLRLGSIIPLIVLHFLWDATIFIGQQPQLRHSLAVGRSEAYVLLPIAGGITWLAEIARRQRSRPPPSAPPQSAPPPSPSRSAS